MTYEDYAGMKRSKLARIKIFGQSYHKTKHPLFLKRVHELKDEVRELDAAYPAHAETFRREWEKVQQTRREWAEMQNALDAPHFEEPSRQAA